MSNVLSVESVGFLINRFNIKLKEFGLNNRKRVIFTDLLNRLILCVESVESVDVESVG